MPLYLKMRSSTVITNLADRQPRISRRKQCLDVVMEELLQEREQTLRREFENEVKMLREEKQKTEESQAEYVRLQESYESQLLSKKQAIQRLMAERNHLSQMNLMHRSDKKELEEERDKKEEELRKMEKKYTNSEVEKRRVVEGKRKMEYHLQGYKRELSKKNKEVAQYKSECSRLRQVNKQCIEEEKSKYDML